MIWWQNYQNFIFTRKKFQKDNHRAFIHSWNRSYLLCDALKWMYYVKSFNDKWVRLMNIFPSLQIFLDKYHPLFPIKVDLFPTLSITIYTTQGLKFKINHHTSNISNPAMSNTPMKKAFFDRVVKVWLHLFTNHLKSLSYVALHRAPIEKKTWSLVRPCVTNSLPTLILGLSKLWYSSSQSMSKSFATISPAYFEKEDFTFNDKW